MLSDTQVIFVPDQVKGGSQGYLLFGRNSTLRPLRFDADRLEMAGEPVPVAKEVPFFEPTAWSEFEASADGIRPIPLGRTRRSSPGSTAAGASQERWAIRRVFRAIKHLAGW